MTLGDHDRGRGYRRGAVMGLTIAEAFILITFALLLLFAFWQWKVDQENTLDVQEFRSLTEKDRQTFLKIQSDGSLDAFIALSNSGVNFSAPVVLEDPQNKWRFIDQAELTRLLDAAEQLPEDLQRNLTDLVRSEGAAEILREMALLEELVASGQSIAEMIAQNEMAQAIAQSDHDISELLQTARLLETLGKTGQTLEDVLATADLISDLEQYRRTLPTCEQYMTANLL